MNDVAKMPVKDRVYARQIAFCAAFILPMGKMLEAPALLSRYAKGDILLPAILQFLVQTLVLVGVLYAASKSEKSLLERLQERLGKGIYLLYVFYGVYFLFAALLPLFDLEKFVYAAFFDTAPTTFSFGVFFFLLAFVCAKGLKSFGRCADLSLFLFLIPFLALVGMAFFESDLSRLFPFFGTEFRGVARAFARSTPHFSDVALLLPLIVSHRQKEGEGVKITLGYFAGALFTLLFLALFFGIYASISSREHYAFSKIAQYFPALDIIGRLDLIFVYLLTVVLLFYTCLPVLYVTECTAHLLGTERKSLLSAIFSLALFLALLFLNRYYNLVYEAISGKLPWIFWLIADMVPLFCLFLPNDKKINPVKKSVKKEQPHAEIS